MVAHGHTSQRFMLGGGRDADGEDSPVQESADNAVNDGADNGKLMLRSDVTVELVKHSAADSDVVWAARVSTAGEQSLEELAKDPERSRGLINYLMRDRHGTPFEHNSMTFFISAPMAVLFDLTPVTAGWLGMVLVYWPYFIHANVRLPLRGLTRVVVGPQVHRIHHSLESAHVDRNFAAVVPLWDILFGTFTAPQKGEFPRTGLRSGERVQSLWQANLLPFTGWQRMWRARRVRPMRPG